MSHHGYPSLHRIQAHLEDLRLQEQDALELLSHPESKPGTHVQLRALVRRIREERVGLERSVASLLTAGQWRSSSIQ